ncbi:hypothetical protein TERTU_2928 [Teredinibacter turnerae T7901]|uniref:Uncharacterized protein n=1 Tax=Teredinibacter turnerae (strain ATCC 39867 / T7901) TaxID=377629 RepID=C5BND9_TERTT|nr:hypothetical protein TERTU_2928 [Teredinibacter turnerae T7901]
MCVSHASSMLFKYTVIYRRCTSSTGGFEGQLGTVYCVAFWPQDWGNAWPAGQTGAN